MAKCQSHGGLTIKKIDEWRPSDFGGDPTWHFYCGWRP